MNKKIFFFHVPKSAGTSIISALKRGMPTATFAPMIENNTEDHEKINGRYGIYKGYDVYAGHYGKDVFDSVRDGHRYFSSFRHPVSRITSLYNYFRALSMSESDITRPCHRMVYLAKTLDFDDFVSSSDHHVRLYIENAHARQLAASFYITGIETSLQEITDFIDGMCCLFVAEYPSLSQRWMKDVLGICNIESLNVTTASDQCAPIKGVSDFAFAAIMQRNCLDLAIYTYAVDRLLRSPIG